MHGRIQRSLISCAGSLAIAAIVAGASHAQTAAYRNRLLGVYDGQTGSPIEGAEVVDRMQKMTAKTTATGTVTLVFLPDGGSLVHVQKIGYQPKDMFVAISPADTVPVMVLLEPVATVLPTMVTRDTARKYLSPALNAFEERRKTNVGGHFITEAELRKSDNRKMTDVARSLPGMQLRCGKPGGPRASECWPVSFRSQSKYAILGGECAVDIYVDGVPYSDNDLNKFIVAEYAAIEYYAGAASVPPQFNQTGSTCGVLLFWTRER